MRISATYVCPVRGLVNLEAPEPVRLCQAARIAKEFGVESLLLPVFEASLSGSAKAKVSYMGGILRSLDAVSDGGLFEQLIAPAQKVLGLD